MAVDVTVPQIGESVQTVFVSRWLKKPGDAVAAGEGLIEVDSDKASMEIPSPVAGTLAERLVEEGDEVEVGAPLARIEEGAGAGPVEAPPVAEAPAPANEAVRAGPAARQVAHEKGVDLGSVKGSGRHGRVMSSDVARAANEPAAASTAPAARPALPPDDVTSELEMPRVERVPMSPLRRTIARRLVEAQQTAAMLTTFNECDMTGIMSLRKQYQDSFVARYGIKLGFMSFFVKAVIEALKEYPAVNAEIDGNDVVYKKYYNIGVAVSTKRGLVVPIVRDADRLSFAQTEQAINELAGRARDGKLTPADFQDGTFTISNGGVFGSLMSTPILNPPQVGILGMHSIQNRPVEHEGGIALRPMMYLALSYDHRIIDGREAVSFLVRVKQLVENPERILLEV